MDRQPDDRIASVGLKRLLESLKELVLPTFCDVCGDGWWSSVSKD